MFRKKIKKKLTSNCLSTLNGYEENCNTEKKIRNKTKKKKKKNKKKKAKEGKRRNV